MSHGHSHISEVRDPGPLAPADYRDLATLGTTLLCVGLAALGVQLINDLRLACVAYLEGFFYALCLGMAGVFFVAVNYAANSTWSVPLRRLMEALSSYLPYAFWTFIPIIAVHGWIYEWSDPEAHLGPSKTTYFQLPFWAGRILIFLLAWNLFAAWFRNASVRQDTDKQELAPKLIAALFLAFFGISFTIFSVDLLMSVRVHWFSTIWGVYCFAGMFQAGLCILILLAIYLRARGPFRDIFTERHLFDLGTWMLAWCTFMVYIGFSQFMLIWYANLPEETPFFIDRFKAGWMWIYLVVFFLKWAVPFLVLMPKPARRCHKVLGRMALVILLTEWLDIYWMISPEFILHNAISLHTLLSFLVGLGFLGAVLLCVARFLRSHSIVPAGDPRLLSSVRGDHL